MLRRNGPVTKSVESVVGPEESMVGKICEIGRMRPIGLTPRTEKHICHSYTSELYNTVVLLYTSPSS